MGKISVNGLRLEGYHGVMEQERRVGNTFEVTIILDVPDSDLAASTDCLDDTINYALVVDIVKEQMKVPSKLIEAVAGRIVKALRARFGTQIASGSVTIAKLAPPIPAQLDSVAFTLEF